MNITPVVTNWSADNKQFSLVFEENPLADFVELPDDGKAQDELWFSNILCGVLRGALEMVRLGDQTGSWSSSSLHQRQTSILATDAELYNSNPGLRSKADTKQVQMQIEAHFVSDILRGDEATEMRITLLKYIEDEMPPDDE